MALKKGKSSSAQPRKKTSRRLNINGTEKTPADQLMTRVVDYDNQDPIKAFCFLPRNSG